MIYKKTEKEIAIMAAGGKILAEVLFKILDYARPGVSELELDAMAEKLIREKGGEPGFKKVPGYKHTICVSTNSVVVHGIPTEHKLREGDVLGIDCGVYYEGFHTDMAETIRIGAREAHDPPTATQLEAGVGSPRVDTFLNTGKRALNEAIKMAKPGNRIGHISKTIQDIVEGGGYSVVRSLIGHGVGRELHEEPEVPGYLNRKIEKTPLLMEGITIAIEVIYNMEKKEVVLTNDDGWTISTADGSISGLFERTVAITKNDLVILTQ